MFTLAFSFRGAIARGASAAITAVFASQVQLHAQTVPSGAPQDLTGMGQVSVSVDGVPDPVFAAEEARYPGDITSLSTWRGFSHQGKRVITLTLPKSADIVSISVRALQDFPLGIYFPRYVEFQFESNGKWYSAGREASAYPLSTRNVMAQTFTWSSPSGLEASAVRIIVPVDVWVFLDGFDVKGFLNVKGAPVSALTPVATNPDKPLGPLLPTAPNAYGIRNMLLVETGANGSLGTWSEQDFVPMLAYVTESGQITAPLFDTMLFLPYGSVPTTQAGLSAYLQDLFAPDKQLSALNEAVGYVNQALHRPGYKERVVLSLPYFAYGQASFGTIGGSTVNFGGSPGDPDALSSRESAETWYVQQLLDAWNRAGFSNLQLVGLYWNEEQFRDTMPGEAAYVQFASQLAAAHHLPLFWIPFYGAAGIADWKSLGFSAAWIQPNFVEQGSQAYLERMVNAAQTASQYGMGVEVELTGISQQDQALYDSSLAQLSAYGFGTNQASHVYYDGSKLLLTSARSTGQARVAYDTTASFIAGVGIRGGS
ncbi:DUF4855 domain-containing protein [Alicyclobacillus mali]|uniref:DUF4855 domain-containing protein n=1 Tax=Alicyclobacillus mali (ex Roth et al. 2021) TaxID=1123961 RepID=A0ABS0F1A2_9BACL|nr:DUF4855 domain-containing protein [Alicyclobacillus mali (ex Roth et al. 2021)]MBF8377073.1 DUF4855 domain-containing protein [Alicyclobacillus mali (ex Roth et al. 2021)]